MFSARDLIVLANVIDSLESILGENTIDRIKQWVRDGGTMITLRNATSWAISSKFVNGKFADRPQRETPERMDYVTSRDFYGSNAIGGSMYMTDVDITHPLAFGYTSRELRPIQYIIVRRLLFFSSLKLKGDTLVKRLAFMNIFAKASPKTNAEDQGINA